MDISPSLVMALSGTFLLLASLLFIVLRRKKSEREGAQDKDVPSIGKIMDSHGARLVAQSSVSVILIIAILQIILGVFLNISTLVTGILILVLILIVKYWLSRIASALLLAYFLLELAVPIIAPSPDSGFSGMRMLILLAGIWFSSRAIESTWLLNGKFKNSENTAQS